MGRLKIVYPVCCGMDVHRDFLIACIAATNAQGVTEYQSRRFSTYTGSLRELRDWLLANDCKDVCMESTGKYWFPVHNILEESCHVVVSHPKFVKAEEVEYVRYLATGAEVPISNSWTHSNFPDIVFADLGPDPILPDPVDTVLEVTLKE